MGEPGQMLTCEGCYFWRREGAALDGQCRRHAPQIIQGRLQPLATWPVTLFDDGCGDARPRPSHPNFDGPGAQSSRNVVELRR